MSIRFGFPRRGSCAAASLAFMSCAATFGTTWQFADTTGFSTLGLNSPTAVNFRGVGDLTITRTSAFGASLSAATTTRTMSQTIGAHTNPDWVVGARSYFRLNYSESSNQAGRGTVSYQFEFSGGLAPSSKLVFLDFDVLEKVAIKAYDASNNLISFGNFALQLSAGLDSTPRYQDWQWAASAGSSGVLSNIFVNEEDDIVGSLSSTVAIHRLVYEFDLDDGFVGAGSASSVRFNFAAQPLAAAIPLPGAAGLAACGLLGLGRRRRR